MYIAKGKYKDAKCMRKGSIRLTKIKIRNAMFNLIGEKIIDARILDLFSGTGFMAIDALSRGAKSAIMNDICLRNLEIAKINCDFIGVQESIQFLNEDGSKIKLPFNEIDIVFIDPPYKESSLLFDSILNLKLNKSDEKKIICCCEFSINSIISIEKLILLLKTDIKIYRHGKTHYCVFTI